MDQKTIHYTIVAIRGPVKDTFRNPIDSLGIVDSPLGRVHQAGRRVNYKTTSTEVMRRSNLQYTLSLVTSTWDEQ